MTDNIRDALASLIDGDTAGFKSSIEISLQDRAQDRINLATAEMSADILGGVTVPQETPED